MHLLRGNVVDEPAARLVRPAEGRARITACIDQMVREGRTSARADLPMKEWMRASHAQRIAEALTDEPRKRWHAHVSCGATYYI